MIRAKNLLHGHKIVFIELKKGRLFAKQIIKFYGTKNILNKLFVSVFREYLHLKCYLLNYW